MSCAHKQYLQARHGKQVLGRHKDHPIAGTELIRAEPHLAPYAYACISHFTKGASPKALLKAGVKKKQVAVFRRLIDLQTLTWEECCVALADACVMGSTPVHPTQRFADLRERYEHHDVIALQESATEAIRTRIAGVIGRDPLGLLPLATA